MDTPEALSWIGSAVRERREELGLAQEGLAATCRDLGMGLTRAEIALIEHGKRNVGVIESLGLAAALGTTLNGLLYGPSVGTINEPTDDDRDPAPMRVDMGVQHINTFALGEVLGPVGLTATDPTKEPMAYSWSHVVDAGDVDPSVAQQRINRRLYDPELAELVDDGYDAETVQGVIAAVSDQLAPDMPPVPRFQGRTFKSFEDWQQREPITWDMLEDTPRTVTNLVWWLVNKRLAETGGVNTARGTVNVQVAARRRVRRAIDEAIAAQQERGGKR